MRRECSRTCTRLEFVDLATRLAQIEAHPTVRAPLPAILRPSRAGETNLRAVLHAGNGLTWSQVAIELIGNPSIRLTAPGQEGRHTFSKRTKLRCRHVGAA